MRLSIIIILLLFFGSCVSINKATRINLKYSGLTKHFIVMKIPKGYKLIKINTGGEGSEYRYLYAD